MSVKIENTKPPNGGSITINPSGHIQVQGKIDETCTLNAYLKPNGGTEILSNDNPQFIAVRSGLNVTWTFDFGPGLTLGQNTLRVTVSNSNGTTSVSITITLNAREQPPGRRGSKRGKKDAAPTGPKGNEA